jgi:hypothetical protein
VVNSDVSREHAEIAKDDTGFLLRDRGSRYGTFVNGEAITERRSRTAIASDGADRPRRARLPDRGGDSALGTGTSDLNDLRPDGGGAQWACGRSGRAACSKKC